MKTEKYIMDHISQHNISLEKVTKHTGVNMKAVFNQEQELKADELAAVCYYLKLDADKMMNTLF